MTFSPLEQWLRRNVFSLASEMRLSFLPPLMVYMAFGISGLTGIVGTFFVKDYLGLSAAFLAALGFWAGIPWGLKMPMGHLVDLFWRWKSWLVCLGALLMAASLLIMEQLIGRRDAMAAILSPETWFVISTLLAPIGYVLQDTVADAMTVEAVPRVNEAGRPIDEPARKLMHTTMQTLGRVAVIGGGVLVSVVNIWLFAGVNGKPGPETVLLYRKVYRMALLIPAVSVLGVATAALLRVRDRRRLRRRGFSAAQAVEMTSERAERVAPNWPILLGSLVFVLFTVGLGLTNMPINAESIFAGSLSIVALFNEEIVFAGSLGIVMYLVVRLTRELEPDARRTLVGTAVVIFMFRAIPGPGPGTTWWMIDQLGFDPQFLSVLSLLGSAMALGGMFFLRRFMAEHSIVYVVGFLAVAGFLFGLPILGMFYGLHEWTARLTGGVVDARFIVLVDTAVESPLGQVAMIPMLAWIAKSAPAGSKATYFAVMASFTNLALSLSQLGTKYLNQVFVITREIRDPATGLVQTPANYSDLGILLAVQMVIGLGVPLAAILFSRHTRFRSD